MVSIKSILAISTITLFTACGGGGGDSSSDSTPVAATYPIKAAMAASKQVSTQGRFTISGSCSGSGTENIGAPVASTLYGSSYSRTGAISLVYSNCSGSGAQTAIMYLDSQYQTIAVVSSNGSFSEATIVNSVPVTVKAGDTLTLASLRGYTNSTKTTLKWTAVRTLVVSQDTESSVILNVITQSYDTANKLTDTTQSKQRLTSSGVLQDVSYQVDLPSGQNETWTYY